MLVNSTKTILLLLALVLIQTNCTRVHYVKKKKNSSEKPATDHHSSNEQTPKTNPSPDPSNTGPSDPNGQNPNSDPNPGPQPTMPPLPEVINKPVQVVELLRIYCKGCHAIEAYNTKFIVSDIDADVIKYILGNKTAKNVNWAEAIVRSLSWPNHQAPAENSKDLMPIGGKKFDIEGNNFSSSATDRQLLIDKVQELIKASP